MLRRILALVALFLFVGSLLVGAAFVLRFELIRWRQDLPAFTHQPGAVTYARVAMRDGVELATQIALPAPPASEDDAMDAADEAPPRWPVVLIRNPYPRFDRMVKHLWCGVLVRYGFGCIYQDVRGQMASGGEWEPFVNEREDGLDTLAWLTKQAFQDGNLALYGPSYLGAVQWTLADSLPPEVKTLIPIVVTTDFRRAVFERGLFRHETFTAWAAMMRDGTMHRGAGDDYQAALRHRPHAEADAAYFDGPLDWYREWIASPAIDDALWQGEGFAALRATPAGIDVPVLMIGGWYDVFFGPQADDFLALGSRDRSRFVIGPWTHGGRPAGVFDLPDAGGGLTQWKTVLDWLGHHLRGDPLAQPASGVANYVMGEARWAERPVWPPPSRTRSWFLEAGPERAGCTVGALATEPPATVQRIAYRYDPDDPTPTLGGSGMLAFLLPGFGGAPPANQWQREPCERADVVSFLSPPIDAPLHLAGSGALHLTVRSDAEDTAFHAKLIEVFDDGRAVNVRDAITSLAFRDGSGRRQTYRAGETVDLEIPLWPIEWIFRAGSRLRVDVASADFPKYHAHPNRAEPWASVREARVAEQTLELGGASAARLELPILEARP